METSKITIALWLLTSLCAIAVTYPYMLYPLILRILPARRIRGSRTVSQGGSEFALLFCAYNEADALADKVKNLQNLRNKYPELQIFAYDDCSSDNTAEILDRAGADVRVIRGSARAGKAHGMKALAKVTDREFLVFTDANVELAQDALDRLVGSYADPAVGGVCGVLRYVDVDGSPTAHAGGLYWRLEETLKSLESRSGNVMGADGSIFSIRRSLYPEFPDTVLDDMTVSMSVVFGGYRLIKNPLVVASEKLVGSRQDDYRRRIRIAMRCFHTHMWFRQQLRAMSTMDRWRWWSHRYLRWHGAFFLIIGYLSGLGALLVGGHAVVAGAVVVATVIVALVGTYISLGPVSTLVHLLSSIIVTGLGVLKARRGQTMATWKPPAR